MTEVHAALDVCITTSGSCGSGASTLVTALVSVIVGAALGFVGAYFLGRQQRGFLKDQAHFERQMEVVKALDEALVETELRITKRGLLEGEDRWEAAHREWNQGWVRASPFLANLDVKDRYEAVGTLLSELSIYEGEARMGRLRNIAMRATQNARLGIAYFGREDELPATCFPDAQTLIGLLGEADPDPFLPDGPLQRWLGAHPAPPWHPEQD
jgi:hypothetical protein